MNKADKLAAFLVPVFYFFAYTPLGMDTTDFGYFYGYAWRILQGQVPYRDFYYIKPALPLYWHAFWMWLTPENWQILAGKTGFMSEMLASAWLGSLYLAKVFKLAKMRLPATLLATTGFVFSVHTFPHMPWHTADGAFFCSVSLFAAGAGHPLISGVAAACATLCKQSFALVPLGLACFLFFRHRQAVKWFLAGLVLVLFSGAISLNLAGAWRPFLEMTTGQLDIREALDAGLLIYLRQNWLLPLAALLPWALFRLQKKHLPPFLMPAYCYLAGLCFCYILKVYTEKHWIGFGLSWPTFFMALGAICIFFPGRILAPIQVQSNGGNFRLEASISLAAALLVSWSCAISGGYKIPAFFSTPLLFSFYAVHAAFAGSALRLAWFTLVTGLVMFWTGYQYPYVFPERPLSAKAIMLDAGAIYPKATGVKVDEDMYQRLKELKWLRQKYGPAYKTLPGFTLSYYLNDDWPALSSDWLIDWEINGKVDQLYNELLEKKLTVFMERDQADATRADAYERAGYGVPQLVRKNWRIVEETPHFIVFQPPTTSSSVQKGNAEQ